MKTYNRLFDKIVSVENIEEAIFEAAKGKRNKASVQYALRHSSKIAEKISQQLKSFAWRPKAIHDARIINDGVRAKKRIIVCPEFIREQIVHHAIMRVCAPLFMRKFYRYSCGSVPGKGKEFAVKHIAKWLKRKQAKYFTVFDVRKCYDNITPLEAIKAIRRTISDKRVLLLFALILHNNMIRMPSGEIVRKGLLMGMFTSPWIANIVLNPLDHLLKEKCGVDNYVRYMDDVLIIHSNKRKLQKALNAARDWLNDYGLSFKRPPAIHRVRLVKINYIGYTLTPDKTVLCSATYLKIRRTINRISKKPAINIYDARRVVSYAGQFKAADTRGAFKRHIAAKVSVKKCRQIISRGKRRHNKCFGKNVNLTQNQKNSQNLKTEE